MAVKTIPGVRPALAVTAFARRVVLASALAFGLTACGEDNDPQSALPGNAVGHDQMHDHPAAHSGDGAAMSSQQEPAASAEGFSAINPYVREPAPGQPMAAAFITLRNTSDRAFTLSEVSSPRANSVEVHRTVHEDGMMAMRHVHHLVIAPQSELVFEPGGYHLMLSKLDKPFEQGEEIPLTLRFESGVTLDVVAEVRSLR